MDGDTGTLRAGADGGPAPWVGAVGVLLVGVGGAWSAGNMGGVVNELAAEFELSLPTLGLLSGTIFFGATVAGLIVAPRVAERLGITRAIALGCGIGALGSIVFAAGGGFAMLAFGRVLAGFGLGLAAALGPVLARTTGGIARVGLFGAAFQLGIACGLGASSLLADAGVDWRVGFVVTAVAAASAAPFILAVPLEVERREPVRGFAAAAVRSGDAWRLGVLFIAMFAVPLTLGAWFVHYVTVDGDVGKSLAGILAFVLFGVSALMRELGGTLARRGVSPVALAGACPLLAAAGLVGLGIEVEPGVVAAAVLLMGAGFALPYATMMVEGQKLLPAEPSRPTALLSMLGTGVAIPVVPLMGGLLDSGDGELAFIALGGLVVLAGLLNLRPAGRPVLGGGEPPG